jgi:hypothetical protein
MLHQECIIYLKKALQFLFIKFLCQSSILNYGILVEKKELKKERKKLNNQFV